MAALRAPEHQVAGHQAREGQLGPLVDSSGRFYKPLQGNARGDREAAFYSSLASCPGVPHRVRRFFPRFHGTAVLPASDGRGPHPHLILDDLLHPFAAPSLVDLKIGSRTWYPSAPDDYVRKCLEKDRETTSLPLGFRVSGLQIHQGPGSGFYRPGKALVKRFGVSDVRRVLRQFVSANPASDPDPDCALAVRIYGGAGGVLSQLLELKAWFEDQTLFHFYSASVLMAYEREAVESGSARAMVRLIDFAHVVEGEGVIDHNFLGGLCSLIKFLSEIVAGHGEGFNRRVLRAVAVEGEEDKEMKKESRLCIENGG